MSRPRQKSSGKWEVTLHHPLLPNGRRSVTFDTEQEAVMYEQQWRLMKAAGISPPEQLMQPANPQPERNLGYVVRQWAGSGLAAPSQESALNSLMAEVGLVKISHATYAWLMQYIQDLKVKNNLAPNSIRHRVQALGRALDEYMRKHPEMVMQNPCRLLPKGYSSYSELDKKLALAAGKKVKTDVARDRRLAPGEEDKIIYVLSGGRRPDRERALELKGGNALLTLYLLIVNTGLRLREAYMLKRSQVDMDAKVIRVQSSKQWRGKVVFRDVPMRPEVYEALRVYLSTRAMLPQANLFPFMDEEPDLPLKKVSQRLSFRFLIAFKYAGINGLHEHDLRHEATCRWLEMRDASGNWMFRLEEVNKIMGWSHNSTMAQRYASFRGADFAARLWAGVPQTPAGAAGRGAAA